MIFIKYYSANYQAWQNVVFLHFHKNSRLNLNFILNFKEIFIFNQVFFFAQMNI